MAASRPCASISTNGSKLKPRQLVLNRGGVGVGQEGVEGLRVGRRSKRTAPGWAGEAVRPQPLLTTANKLRISSAIAPNGPLMVCLVTHTSFG